MHMSDLKILIFPDPKLRKVAKKIQKFDKIIKSKKRINCAPPAPAEGLYLTKVIY